ncbi:MAG: RHS repeat domain-containing protein [Bryobacteraceae bacterium]
MTYAYDMGTNGKGHLTSIANARSATNVTGFDALGHVLASTQATAGQTYNFDFAYNLAGALTSETYPSGRVLTMSRDGANRVTKVAGAFNGRQTQYATVLSYTPQGTPTFYSYGNGLVRAQSYNSRLQF